MRDVVVVGAGPAGLALARSLADRGVDVVVVAAETRWAATYGAWRDDVAACELGADLDSVLRGRWSTVRVVGAREHVLPRPYVVFDNTRLRAALVRGIEIVDGAVVSIEHAVDHSSVRFDDRATIAARLVIDATGDGRFLARREASAGAQSAYGLVLGPDETGRTAALGIEDDVFTLMDWSRPPTFLYAARFLDGTTLVEETSLYADPPRPIEMLRGVLAARVGADLTDAALSVERVGIPMGSPLPATVTRTVGFGAAAGYVHPVTGYSVSASLRMAPRVADAISAALGRSASAGELSSSAWSAVWPRDMVRTRAWHDAGLAVIRSLPPELVARFFDAFFDLPQHAYAAYLRVDGAPREIRAAMFGVFRRVDGPTRLRLMSRPDALLRALAAR